MREMKNNQSRLAQNERVPRGMSREKKKLDYKMYLNLLRRDF